MAFYIAYPFKMKRVLIILSIPLILIFWFAQHRYFYHFNNGKSITVWKTFGGTCYIIPGNYLGLLRPKINYISTYNTDNVIIVCDKNSAYDFIVENRLANTMSIKMPNYKVRHYPEIDYASFEEKYPRNDSSHTIEHLEIDVEEMYAVLDGKKQ